ncbi:MAG TPA: ABC transporter ATP-binding protein [Dongiaceae bacterium]
MTAVLEVRDLEVRFETADGTVEAVNRVSFAIQPGETLGIVGESGSGKSQVFMSVMGLLASNGKAAGSIKFQGDEILGRSARELNHIRGTRMTMIFQDPMTSLNPYLTIERQLTEVMVTHRHMTRRQARDAAIAMLERVQIPKAAERIGLYPFEFSGGMRQRAMIAMALLGQPELLIADEPTTALDVTVQAQILELLAELRRAGKTSFAVITHDLGVIAGLCDYVLVMYAGRIVESGPVQDIFKDPQHPYTAGLLASMPRLDATDMTRLATIAGQPPNLQRLPPGCAFNDRCGYVMERCLVERPALREFAPGRRKACHLDRL